MGNKDVFSSVYRWARRQGENFTTDAFVYLLKELLDREPPIARGLLSWLCFGDANPNAFANLCARHIDTQCRDEEGTPDIWIRTSDTLVLIEVKKGRDLRRGQLRDYRQLLNRALQNQCARTGALVLLTAYRATFEPDEKPDQERRWSDVERWFEKNPASGTVPQFLVEQFIRFLRGQVMTIEKVEWQYVEGARSLSRLTAMLAKACENLGVAVEKGSAHGHQGWYIKGEPFWLGVYLNQPDSLVFEYTKDDAQAKKELTDRAWQLLDNKNVADVFKLTGERNYFFAREKDSQLKAIEDFVKKAYDVGKQWAP